MRIFAIASGCLVAGFAAGWMGATFTGSGQLAQDTKNPNAINNRATQVEGVSSSSDVPAVRSTNTASALAGSPNVGFETGGLPAALNSSDQNSAGRSAYSQQTNEAEIRTTQRDRERELRQAAAQMARSAATTRVESLRLALNLRPDQVAVSMQFWMA